MKVKVCVKQDSPVFFDKEQTIAKVEKLTSEYARQGCRLVVFPESFIPGYPRGFSFGTRMGGRTSEGRKLYSEYLAQSMDLEGDELVRLETLSREQDVYLVIGVTEKLNSSLYCSMLYISPREGLLGVHRKIKPTAFERVIWGEAGGEDLCTFDTSIGRLGGLICWENYMPLARMAMYRKGVEIYLAPTADARQRWNHTMVHIALEGRCFVLGCNQYMTKSMYPERFRSLVAPEEIEEFCPGGSVIVSPLGKILAGPLYGEAGALIADLDLSEISQARLDFDVTGHYSRNDIFKLEIRDQPDIRKESMNNEE
jgi:nitrilase